MLGVVENTAMASSAPRAQAPTVDCPSVTRVLVATNSVALPGGGTLTANLFKLVKSSNPSVICAYQAVGQVKNAPQDGTLRAVLSQHNCAEIDQKTARSRFIAAGTSGSVKSGREEPRQGNTRFFARATFLGTVAQTACAS